MRKSIKFVLLVLLSTTIFGKKSFAQNEPFSESRTRTYAETDFALDKVYYKGTDKRVTPEEFEKIVKKNKSISFEREIDRYGDITRYYYDPKNEGKIFQPDPNNVASPGDDYPPFTFKTIDGQRIALEDMKGMLVLLRFEMEASGQMFKKHEIEALDAQIKEEGIEDVIVPIVIFLAPQDLVKSELDLPETNFLVVADGRNFVDKFQINRFPMSVLLDHEGKLIKYFYYPDNVQITEYVD